MVWSWPPWPLSWPRGTCACSQIQYIRIRSTKVGSHAISFFPLKDNLILVYFPQVKSTTHILQMQLVWRVRGNPIRGLLAWICSPFCWWPLQMRIVYRNSLVIIEFPHSNSQDHNQSSLVRAKTRVETRLEVFPKVLELQI